MGIPNKSLRWPLVLRVSLIAGMCDSELIDSFAFNSSILSAQIFHCIGMGSIRTSLALRFGNFFLIL